MGISNLVHSCWTPLLMEFVMLKNRIRLFALVLGLGALIAIPATGDLDVETLSLDLPAPMANVVMAKVTEEALHPAYQATWNACESLPSWGGIDRKVEKAITGILTSSFEVTNQLVR